MSGDASAVEASLAVADPFPFAGDEALTYPAAIMIGTDIESLTRYRNSPSVDQGNYCFEKSCGN